MIRRRSSGVFWKSRQAMMALTHTDLPEPVVPAMSRWGMAVRSAATGVPSTLWPRPMRSVESIRFSSGLSITSRRLTSAVSALGTSMPTNPLPGTGASMRIERAARESARSSARRAMACTLTRVRLPPRPSM